MQEVFSWCHFPFFLGSTTQFGKQIWREFFRQIKVLESAGILYVFQTFQTAELAKKGRQSALAQLCGVALIYHSISALIPQYTRIP